MPARTSNACAPPAPPAADASPRPSQRVRHSLTHRLPYTPAQLFDLVADVERYPAFVPWVSEMRVTRRREGSPDLSLFDAQAKIGFAFVRERFSTAVRADKAAMTIDASLISGPFRRLENHLRFAPAPGGGSELNFSIDFEFGSRLLQGLLTTNFERAVDKLIGCFERRAAALYGRAGTPG